MMYIKFLEMHIHSSTYYIILWAYQTFKILNTGYWYWSNYLNINLKIKHLKKQIGVIVTWSCQVEPWQPRGHGDNNKFDGLEAELTMSKNVILRKMHFKVSITAKKSEMLIHNVILCRYVRCSQFYHKLYPWVSWLINHCVDYKMAEMDLKTGHGLFWLMSIKVFLVLSQNWTWPVLAQN